MQRNEQDNDPRYTCSKVARGSLIVFLSQLLRYRHLADLDAVIAANKYRAVGKQT